MAAAQRWIDGHLDLAYLAVNGRDITTPVPADLDACISLPALRETGVDLVFATIFTEMNFTGSQTTEAQVYARDDFEAAGRCGLKQLEVYEQLEEAGELSIVRRADDLTDERPAPRIVILMEGADPIRSPADVEFWHSRGVRIVGLTWAMGSKYAGGNVTGGGLTSAGRHLVAALDELGIVHDVSHLAEQALHELLDCTTGPVLASHSNARAVDHTYGERSLSDDQIRAIAELSGVIGINLFTKFLATGHRATIADVVAHIEHITGVMGHRRGVGLGSDMDGGFAASKLAEGLDRPQSLPALADALCTAGWSDSEIDGFACGNWLRILEHVLA